LLSKTPHQPDLLHLGVLLWYNTFTHNEPRITIMSNLRLAFAAALLALTAVACSRSEEPAEPANALLGYVPADTPYLAANLEPLPEAVIDAYLSRMQPALDEMQTQLSAARARLEAGQDGSGGLAEDDTAARLALAVLSQLDGNLSRAGLSGLGLDITAHKVVYGLGVFPVVRMGLSAPDSLRGTIRTVLRDAGIGDIEQSYQGTGYWRVLADDRSESPLALYLAVLDDHFALGLLPPAFETELLPGFLGLAPPTESTAAAQLAELNRAHDYTPFGSGILDLHRLANQFFDADTVTARTMAATGEYDPASITAECVSEMRGIIDNAPRMTAGTTEFSTAAIAYQYRLESPASLAAQLAGLVARLPEADADSTRMLELSFGMRVGALRDFLREKATAIVEDPYVCEYLQDINSSAESSLAQLDQPMPPFVNNFRGLRISLSEIALSADFIPGDARGQLALHVEQPEMFVGMAQMFLPDLSTLDLAPGGDPVQIPAGLIPLSGLVAFAAMSSDAIGLSVGAGEEATLQNFLTQKPGPEGVFLSASYDTAAYLDYSDRMGAPADGPAAADDGEHNGTDAVNAIGQAAREAYREMADRSHTTLQFGSDGLVIDGRVTFKP